MTLSSSNTLSRWPTDRILLLGYPVCLVCGQSRSPFSSQTERDRFAEDHQQRCGQRIQPTGFYTDVVPDALSIPECANREKAYSILEALRTGTTRVLEMEAEDLNILNRSGRPRRSLGAALRSDAWWIRIVGSNLLTVCRGRCSRLGSC